MSDQKYQAYPEYKDSGVEWLGVIPSHWSRMKFKFLANQGKIFASGPFGSSIGSQFYRDKGVPVIRGNNLSLGGDKPKYVDNGYVFLDEDKANDLSNAEVLPGDLVFTARGTVGQVGLIPDDGTIKWERAILSANQLRFRNKSSELNSKFLWYLFSSWLIRTQILLSSDSVAQPNLNLGSLKDLHLLCPQYDEQESIANFLENETAQIDALIEKQQQLIKLLKEKRQAVISHAVTKGLNPNAPMRDSGIEWLGEVPTDWIVTKAKYLYDFVTSGSRGWADYYSDNGSLFFRIANLTRDTIEPKFESIQCVTPPLGSEGVRAKIKKNDLLISITADLGSVCVANEEVEGGYVSQHVALCRPNKKVISPRWLGYCILSDLSKEQLLGSGYGGTKIQLSLEDIRELCIVLPRQAEQAEIEEFIDLKLIKFSKLMKKSNDQVLLLQERRTALISAAVTGKIDVRNWQKPLTPPVDKPTSPIRAV